MRTSLPLLVAVPVAMAVGACGTLDPSVEEPSPSATPEPSPTPSATPEPSPTPSGSPEPGPAEPPDEEPSPQSTADFGERAAFVHPVGPHGGPEEREAEVVYTVDGVERPWAGRVDFTLTVRVPDLGRVFSLTDLEVVCEAGPEIPVAQTDEPLGEVAEGTYSTRMWCTIPADADRVRIVVVNGEDEAAFGGRI